MSKKKTKEIVQLLDKFVENINQQDLYDIIYVNNLLINGLIASYKKGKITKAQLDKFVFPERYDDEAP